jgi:hypothetical protein
MPTSMRRRHAIRQAFAGLGLRFAATLDVGQSRSTAP